MIHAKVQPARLTAEQLQMITAAGCSLPLANVIRFPTMDHFDLVSDALALDGLILELIADEDAKPQPMTDEEILILSGWYRDQVHETRERRGQ